MDKTTDLKGREYFERHAYWQNIAISHMSFSINLFLTISLAFLGFIVNSSELNNINFRFSIYQIEMDITLIFMAVIMGGISILCGVFCVLFRIADFNLTRNAVYARKKFYAETGGKLTTEKTKSGGNWFSVIFNPHNFLLSSDFIISEEKDLVNKRLANVIYWKGRLGRKTWLYHKIQILLFALMIFSWIISVLIS